MKELLKRLVNSPIALALLLAVITVAVLPPIVPRHKMRLINQFSAPNRLYAYYTEESDSSISDISLLRSSKTSITLESINKRLHYRDGLSADDYTKIYCPLPPPKRDDVFIEDLDGDTIKDILYITQAADSTFLIQRNTKSLEQESRYFLSDGGQIYYAFVRFFYFSDEIAYFSVLIKKGARQFETTIYSFDKKNKEIETIYSFDNIVRGFQLKEVNNRILFFARGKDYRGIYNLNVKTGICDSIIIDGNDMFSLFLTENSEILPYSYSLDHLIGHSENNLFYLDIDKLIAKGKIERHHIARKKDSESFRLKYIKDGTVLYTIHTQNEGRLYRYNINKNKTKRIRIKGKPLVKSLIYYGDIDNNGKKEIVYTNEKNASESYCILEEDRIYSDICVYPVGREDLHVGNCMKHDNSIIFQSPSNERILKYFKNPEYYKHWLWSSFIAFIIIFVGIFIQKIKEIRIYRKQQANSKILQLQLENVQRRIDPHFIFNSLNNLGSMILNGETDESYDYLSQVSGVLYKALRNRGVLMTIEDELNFCTSVLDTQCIRFKNRFEYEVYVDKEVNTETLLPSNILNSMTDNCIKHGFAGINYTGLISINIQHQRRGTLVIVEDNGKGRKAAQADKDQSKSTGTGLEICKHYVQLLNHERKTNKLSFKIIDLYTNDIAKGTRCEFYIPNDLSLDTDEKAK